eukprot:SAG31_NODE_1891_length_6975_cov_11.419430_2_plen_152_part_00
MPAANVVKLPASLTFEESCAALVCGTTAHYLAFDAYKIQRGDWVVVHAAAGGVGRLLIQVAKICGAQVIGTCSTKAKAEIIKSCGAAHAILYRGADGETWPAAVHRLTKGDGVACVYDGVGRATFMDDFKVLRKHRGHLVLCEFTCSHLHH